VSLGITGEVLDCVVVDGLRLHLSAARVELFVEGRRPLLAISTETLSAGGRASAAFVDASTPRPPRSLLRWLCLPIPSRRRQLNDVVNL